MNLLEHPTLITNVCFEYVGTDNPVFVFQANFDFIRQENMLLIHPVQLYSAFSTPSYQLCSRVTNYASKLSIMFPATNYARNYASIIGKGLVTRLGTTWNMIQKYIYIFGKLLEYAVIKYKGVMIELV